MKTSKSFIESLELYLLKKLNQKIARRRERKKADLIAALYPPLNQPHPNGRRGTHDTAHTAICYNCLKSFIYKGIKKSNYCEKCMPLPKQNQKEKAAAHEAFDTLWKSGRMTRNEAYIYLGGLLGIPDHLCHIGMFTKDQCLLLQVKLAQSEHSDLFAVSSEPPL